MFRRVIWNGSSIRSTGWPKGDHVRAGTGLGLSICRGFVEAMGGTIAAENRIGHSGAIFTISLPLLTDAPNLKDLK